MSDWILLEQVALGLADCHQIECVRDVCSNQRKRLDAMLHTFSGVTANSPAMHLAMQNLCWSLWLIEMVAEIQDDPTIDTEPENRPRHRFDPEPTVKAMADLEAEVWRRVREER